MLDYCGLAKTVSKALQNMIDVYPIDAYLYSIIALSRYPVKIGNGTVF